MIWTIVSTQDDNVITYFERLYLKCVVNNSRFYDTEEYVNWKELDALFNALNNEDNICDVILHDSNLQQHKLICRFHKEEKLEPAEISVIRDEFKQEYEDLSKAVAIFDSYLKRLNTNRRRYRSDNIVKILIAIISVISTLGAVYFGFSLKMLEAQKTQPNESKLHAQPQVSRDSLLHNIITDKTTHHSH